MNTCSKSENIKHSGSGYFIQRRRVPAGPTGRAEATGNTRHVVTTGHFHVGQVIYQALYVGSTQHYSTRALEEPLLLPAWEKKCLV